MDNSQRVYKRVAGEEIQAMKKMLISKKNVTPLTPPKKGLNLPIEMHSGYLGKQARMTHSEISNNVTKIKKILGAFRQQTKLLLRGNKNRQKVFCY